MENLSHKSGLLKLLQSVSKQVLVLTYNVEMKFFACSLSCKSNLYPYEKLCPWTCFKRERKKQHLEMALVIIFTTVHKWDWQNNFVCQMS